MGRALCLAALAALAGLAQAGQQSTQYTVMYEQFFSGIGQYYNATTQQLMVESVQQTFAPLDASGVNVNPVDFPVAAALTLQGVNLAQWNSISHIQDIFEAGLAADLNLNASQVTLNSFQNVASVAQGTAGLYVPFTVSGLGDTNALALNVAQNLNANEAGSTSGLAKALTAAGLSPVILAPATPPLCTPGDTYPSIGMLADIMVVVPNVTAAEDMVTGNPNLLMELGFLRANLNDNGVYMGPVGGGMYIVTGSLQIIVPPGAPQLSPSAPAVYLAQSPPPAPPGTVRVAVASSADRAVAAVSCLLLAALAALL